jgi:hypothetical protein
MAVPDDRLSAALRAEKGWEMIRQRCVRDPEFLARTQDALMEAADNLTEHWVRIGEILSKSGML